MLTRKQRDAARMLFEMPDEVVAERLGINLDTLRRWKGLKEFREEMRSIDRDARQSVQRMISLSQARAATRLNEAMAVEKDSKPDVKVLIDLLKASGAFGRAEDEKEPGSSLFDAVAEIRQLMVAGE